MSNNTSISYRMLTPLIRTNIDINKKTHYRINNNISIIIKDPQVFQNFNVMNIQNFTHEHFSGMSGIVFTRFPLLVTSFPYVDNYPDHAGMILKNFLDAMALFKTTTGTKFHNGPRIVQTITKQNTIGFLNIRGSDDTSEFHGKIYNLTLSELDEFKNFYNHLTKIISNNPKNKASSAIELYSKASHHLNTIDKFIFLSLALEGLFSKDKDELIFRLSNRISLLLGDNFEERQKISTCIKNVTYRRRSLIIHGSSFKTPPNDEYEYLNEIIRVSILRFLSLANNGISNPIEVIDSFLLKQNTNEYDEFKTKSTSTFNEISNLKFQNIRTKPKK